MDAVKNTNAAGPRPMEMPWKNGTYTVLNISHLLTVSGEKPDPAVTDKVDRSPDKIMGLDGRPVSDRGFWGRISSFTDGAMSSSPVVSGAYSSFTHQVDCAIGSFMDGKISKDELSSQFESIIDTFGSACEDAGYPHPLLCDGAPVVQCRTEALYKEIRSRILQTALSRNDAEGMQYVSGGKGFKGDWKYYNADYYYKTDDALSALFDGVSAYTKDRPGYEDFDLQEILSEFTRYSPNNFNAAWNNRFPLNQQYIVDEHQAPPEGFKWFYQKGGSFGKQHLVVGKVYLNGQEVPEQTIPRAPFNPAKDNSATTWASCRDADGKEHRVSTDFLFDVDGVDKFSVSALLQFIGGDKAVKAASQFLKNFEVNSGNWWRPYETPVIDLRG